jgi:hippurate hydrolase
MGCTAEVEIERGYPVTVNDGGAVGRIEQLSATLLGDRQVHAMPTPIMGAEDFSYVLEQVPGALAFLGGCPPGTDPATAPPNHSNRVVFDEDAMAAGVAVYAALALDALRS